MCWLPCCGPAGRGLSPRLPPGAVQRDNTPALPCRCERTAGICEQRNALGRYWQRVAPSMPPPFPSPMTRRGPGAGSARISSPREVMATRFAPVQWYHTCAVLSPAHCCQLPSLFRCQVGSHARRWRAEPLWRRDARPGISTAAPGGLEPNMKFNYWLCNYGNGVAALTPLARL